MLGILALCIVVILVAILLPVFNGIGSYKKKVLADNPELADRVERRKQRKLAKEKAAAAAASDDGSYRPASWDTQEQESAESFTSSLRDRTSQMMNRGVAFTPSVPEARHSGANQTSRLGQYQDPTKPYSSHIDPNFDYDKFIDEQDEADKREGSVGNKFAKSAEEVA